MQPNPWSYASLGFELAVPLVLFMWVGHRLDLYLGNDKPGFTVAGALLGLVIGFYSLAKRLLAPGKGGDEGRD